MGELHIQVRTLRNRRPILLSWINTENSIIEGCLVTCPCQGYKLNDDTNDESIRALKLSKAMERADVISFYKDVNLTGLVRSNLDEDLESEEEVTPRKRKRHKRARFKNIRDNQENVEEDTEQATAGSKAEEQEEEEEITDMETEEVAKSIDQDESVNGRDTKEDKEDSSTEGSTTPEGNKTRWISAREEDHAEKGSQSNEGTTYIAEEQGAPVIDEDSLEPLSDKLTRVVADEENVGNTVEIGAEDQTDARKTLANDPKTVTMETGDNCIENAFLASSLGLPANSTVTLTDVEGNTYMNVQGVGMLETPHDGTMVSDAGGTNYITMLSDTHQNTLSTEQEQVLLKTLEGFIIATSGEDGVLNESLQIITDGETQTNPDPVETDRYTMKIILGEAQGPLNKKDQVRMDKYRLFKSHKDDEFHRKYHKYQNMKGVNFVLCEICGAPLNNKNVKHHMVALHQAAEERERNFMCNICGRAFLYSSNLQRHMDTHSGVRYKCQYCSKSYSQDHSRKQHERAHFGVHKKTLRNPFAGIDDAENVNSDERGVAFLYCEVCFKRLRPLSLRGHMSVHRNEYFTCSVCQKVLRLSGKREHMLRHNSDKKFECTTCQKKFVSRGSLEAHIRVHTQERPYKCKFCAEMFKTSHTRNTHQRIHTGEKPYSCNKCNKRWRDRTTYWGHMKKHHPGEPLMYIRKSLQIQAARDAVKLKDDDQHVKPSQGQEDMDVHQSTETERSVEVQEVIQVEEELETQIVMQNQDTEVGHDGMQGPAVIQLQDGIDLEGDIQVQGGIQTQTVIQLQDGIQLEGDMQVQEGIQTQTVIQLQDGVQLEGDIQVQGGIQTQTVIQLQGREIPMSSGLQAQSSVQVQNVIQSHAQTPNTIQTQAVKVQETVPHIIVTLVSPSSMDV